MAIATMVLAQGPDDAGIAGCISDGAAQRIPGAIIDDNPGLAGDNGGDAPAMAFLIQDGRIQRAPSDFSRYVGRAVDVFLEELRAISRRAA